MAEVGYNNCIIRIENYKAGSANAIQREQDHKQDRNPDKNYREDLRENNTTLERDENIDRYRNYMDYFKAFREENAPDGRLRLDDSKRGTNVITSTVYALSSELYNKMTEAEREEYFRDCLEFHKTELMPGCHVVDATIHRDEGHWDKGKWVEGQDHLQITSIAVYRDKEKGTHEISTTKVERDFIKRQYEREGKEAPAKPDARLHRQFVQDRFYSFHREKGRDIDRLSPEAGRKHLPVKVFKELQDRQKEIERAEKQLEKDRETLKKQQEKANADRNRAFDDNQKLRQQEKAIAKRAEQIKQDREKLNQDRAKEYEKLEKAYKSYEKDKETIAKAKETADKIRQMKEPEKMKMPEPAGKGLHKGYYTADQVRDLVKEVNKAREMSKDVEKGREVDRFESLQDKLERANTIVINQSQELIKQRLEEYTRDHKFVEYMRENYDMREIEKQFEKDQEREERSHERDHDRSH